MNTTPFPRRRKSRATPQPSNIVPFVRPLPNYEQIRIMDSSAKLWLPIPLTQNDADDWSRFSKAQDKYIPEWGLEVLRNAVTGKAPPAPLPVPSREGNLWSVPMMREDAAAFTKQAAKAGMTTTQWAYSTLAAAWKGGVA
jgi:hypothetical protein